MFEKEHSPEKLLLPVLAASSALFALSSKDLEGDWVHVFDNKDGSKMQARWRCLPVLAACMACSVFATDPPKRVMDIYPKPIASDPEVKYDYDIVYVRAPRYGDDRQIVWSEVFAPMRAEPRRAPSRARCMARKLRS